MSTKHLVTKDNDLIGASYSLGLAEQRLIFLAIIEAREQNVFINVGKSLRIYAKSYEKQFSVEKHTSYEAMKRAVNGLYEAGFSYVKIDEASGKPITYKSRWVEKIGYADDLGCVELTFASDVIPLITRLDGCYTEYELRQVSSLQSEYAIRLYELMMQWKKVGKVPKIELQDLRNKLGVEPEQYQRMTNFKAKVLDHALKQINKHTDITADYDQHKQGKAITGFTFTFKQKPSAKAAAKGANPARDTDTPDMFNNMTDSQIATFSSKLARLPELGNDAPIGGSTDDYATLIATHLADPVKQKKYHAHLSKLGFKAAKSKA